ncbi:hypothetical protein [Paenibacillus glufosinatiresistens]|uniref:hypothetical protein n=1 Tax=Paenibacillus glufosinatiresistens TaxID=3070657 RepID=UPI00286D7AF8|nr:hypothetical protein [Paenibacillus sp. YX.27]
MALITLLSLFGCGKSRDERAADRIVEALQEKYGEEFVLDGIGGSWGTMNPNTLKAIARPKADPTLKVPVEITKDLKQIYDQYLNQRVARSNEPKIQELARKHWPDARIVNVNDTRLAYPESSDTSMTYPEFLKQNPSNTLLVKVYLDASGYVDPKGNMDQEAEIAKYLAFAEELAASGYVSSRISWVYLTPDAFSRLEEAKQSASSVDAFFNEEEETGVPRMITRVGCEIDASGRVKQTKAELQAYLDQWREKRLESLHHWR